MLMCFHCRTKILNDLAELRLAVFSPRRFKKRYTQNGSAKGLLKEVAATCSVSMLDSNVYIVDEKAERVKNAVKEPAIQSL